jgi:hypothetical protein
LAAHMSVEDEYFVDPSTEPDTLLANTIDELVDRLPEAHRDIIRLVMAGVIRPWDPDWTGFREAGRILGVDHKTIKRRLRVALEALAGQLDELPTWLRQLLADRLPADESGDADDPHVTPLAIAQLDTLFKRLGGK